MNFKLWTESCATTISVYIPEGNLSIDIVAWVLVHLFLQMKFDFLWKIINKKLAESMLEIFRKKTLTNSKQGFELQSDSNLVFVVLNK